MTEDNQPWAKRFSPNSLDELVGNEGAVRQLRDWLRSWDKGIPKFRATFLYGPSGVGKTSSVVALANDLDYDLFEVNASDYRTKKRLEELVGRAALQTISITGRRRMILFDELEGVSGVQDRGGISTIASIIKETRVPIVLIATSIGESWEDKFKPLASLSFHIEYKHVPFGAMIRRLVWCIEEIGITVDNEVLELLVDHSEGDLRSTLNDLESIARGKKRVTLEDCGSLSVRDRKDYTPDVLMKLFNAKTLRDARRTVSASYINYDTLYDWIYENLPVVLDDASDLAEGMEALARADIHQTRGKKTQEYKLLKYMFNSMTGGVAFSRHKSEGIGLMKQVRTKIAELGFPPSGFTLMESPEGIMIKPVRYLGNDWRRVNTTLRSIGASWVRSGGYWSLPYYRAPQLVWRYRRTYHSRRRLRSISERVAEKCHISMREAVSEVIPLLKVIYKEDSDMAQDLSNWLELDEKETGWLSS